MDMMEMLLVSWGVITALLIVVMIYRSMLTNREEDQLFLDAAGDSMAQEQRVIVSRIEKLGRPITALTVLSALLLLSAAGMWLYQGYRNF
jgi:Tfp pilus assembly protein PilN